MLITFQLYTKKVPLDPNVDLRTIAASCNGYVGADLEALCREATMIAVRRSSDANEDADVLSLTMEDWEHARSIVGPSITRGVTVEIPKVTWEDIGGLKDLKVCNINFLFCIESLMELLRIPFFIHGQKKLQQAVEWPIKHSAAFSRLGVSPVRGILLHGPPGCSKTTLAKAAAHAAQASFFSLRFELFPCPNKGYVDSAGVLSIIGDSCLEDHTDCLHAAYVGCYKHLEITNQKIKKKHLRLKASNLAVWFLNQSGRQNKWIP